MSNRRPSRNDQSPKLHKLFSAVSDPTPKAIGGGGSINEKDYTRFIKWTPRKIAIATLILGGSYIAVVILVWTKLGLSAALMLLALFLIPALGVGIMYWFSKAVL